MRGHRPVALAYRAFGSALPGALVFSHAGCQVPLGGGTGYQLVFREAARLGKKQSVYRCPVEENNKYRPPPSSFVTDHIGHTLVAGLTASLELGRDD